MSQAELIDKIKALSKTLALKCVNDEATKIAIYGSEQVGINLFFEFDEQENMLFYFVNRTTSWVFSGERTDLHDIISIVFAAYLKKHELCSFYFIDIPNEWSQIKEEIYGRYLVPEQVHPGLLNVKTIDLEALTTLISSIPAFTKTFWSAFPGCPCYSCRKRLGYSFEYRWQNIHPKKLSKAAKLLGEGDGITYMERRLPNWFHYKSLKKGITLLQADKKGLISFLKWCKNEETDSIEGVKGRIIYEGNFKNLLAFKTKTKIESYFAKLHEIKPKFIFFANKILAIANNHFLIFEENVGTSTVTVEVSLIKERHLKEHRLLFTPSNLKWSDKINDSAFENLIKDLLEREPHVRRVRKLAHTRERHGGTDLLAELVVPKNAHEINSEKDSPFKKLNIVVQCKAYKDGVGKSHVTDIRDTVEARDYDGYFLAVSSYTKKSLTDHLDKLKISGKIWVDWWTRSEIEDRIKVHPDLMIKYSTILYEN